MKYLLIDGNSIGYACQFTPVLTSEGMEVQALFGIIRSIGKRITEFKEHYPVVLWDGHPTWRYDLFPDYKSGRKKSEKSLQAREAYKKQLPFMRTMIGVLGITQLISTEAEADDIGFQLAGELAGQGHEVVLMTGDTDWLQGIGPRVTWFDPKFERSASTPEEMAIVVGTGVRMDYLQCKALVGDTSDSIDGVEKIGDKTAPKILEQFQSVTGYFEAVDSGQFVPKTVAMKNLAAAEGREIFQRNMQLIDLSVAPKLTADDIQVDAGPVEPEQFRAWAERFGFKQFLRNFEASMRPFESAKERRGFQELQRAINWLGDDEEEDVPI